MAANTEEDSQDRIENGEGSEKRVDRNDADNTTASDHNVLHVHVTPCSDDIEVKDWVMVDYEDVAYIYPGEVVAKGKGEASEGDSDDSNGEEEEQQEGQGVRGQERGKVKGKGIKQKKQKAAEVTRRRAGGISLGEDAAETKETEDAPEEDEADEPVSTLEEEMPRSAEMKKKEKEKQKADDLWSSFLKDVGQKPKTVKPAASSVTSSGSSSKQASTKQVSPARNGKDAEVSSSDSKKTVTITKVFDFAGEEVKVTEQVSADSKEAKQLSAPSNQASQLTKRTDSGSTISASPSSTSQPSISGAKRPGGGLSSVLGLISKKPKMSVLDKSRLDWNSFTTTEGITEDLKIHNKGKEGYIEKQKFLQQTDQRQYEKERDLRMGLAKR